MSVKKAMENFLNKPTTQSEKELITQLKKATFLAPVILFAPLAKPDGNAVYEEEGSNIKFVILKDDDSNNNGYYPAFTSRDEMKKWRNDSEQEILELKLKDYASMLLDEKNEFEGVVIDAFSHSLVLNMNFIKAIFS